ncbi:MAG: hypothetical protein AB7S77_12765 [Desulfatirhabdiaceae bacterium]
MATRKKMWTYSPPKPTREKSKVPEEIKLYLQEKSEEIVEKIFKPKYLKPIPEEQTLNHIVDIYTKWYRNCFYFCVKYRCPPDSYSSFFESKFVKFEYLGDEKFQYSYMRHTGQWLPTSKMTIDACLEHVVTEIPC